MSVRRVVVIALSAVVLLLGAYAGYGYFSPQKTIKRLTGWTVPAGATLRLQSAEGSSFAGERNYLFDLPGSASTDEVYCASLNLPLASQGSAQKAKIPAGVTPPPQLDGDPVCSRTEVNQRAKTALSIEATRKTVVVRWIYM